MSVHEANLAEAAEEIPEIEEEVTETAPEPIRYTENMSASIGNLAGALAKAQGAMSNGGKDKAGYGYKYMDLGTLINIARPALTDNAISVLQTHELNKGNGVPSVVTHTTVMHESGEWHKSSLELPIKEMPQLSAAQMIGVNCTYGRRYALQAICLIAAEEDTDASPKAAKSSLL